MTSRYPIGDVRRFKTHARGRDSCADRFYEVHYRSWTTTRRAVLRRVRERFGGDVRCENCERKPREYVRRIVLGQGTPWQFEDTLHYSGYEFDHKVELAAGGDPLDVDNVWLLCLRCHRTKTRRFLKGQSTRETPSDRSLEEFS